MYLLTLGLDPKTLDPESVVAFRNRAYGSITTHYTVVVPSRSTMTVKLSDRTTIYGIGGKNKMLQLFKIWQKARHIIREGKCDVITSQDMYYLGLVGLFLARRHHTGLEVQVLGIEKLTPLRKRLACFVLKRAPVVRALSVRIKERLIHEFGVDAKKIEVVTIYVDVNKLGLDVRTLVGQDALQYEKLSSDFQSQYGGKFNFLTVSRLVPIKHIELQIRGLKALVEEGYDALLHIVGDGPEAPTLKACAQELGLASRVVFHGYKTGMELGHFYIACDCFLLTSQYEGWGMVVIEAATAGLPIIMTDVGCAGELIVDGESGVVIPPLNGKALEDAMKRIIDDPTLRDRVSIGATKAVRALPTFEAVLKDYKKNWERALANRL